MRPSRLDPFQHDVLRDFFGRERRFYLTGGAALAGFHLGHRETHDLDLFTLVDALDDGERQLGETARSLGATVASVHTAPDFRRRLLQRGDDAVVVDLVRERVAQRCPDKPEIAGVRVDPPEEILANKLCTILARSEARDLVDAYALERAGHSIEDALPAALAKDGGATPAQLAWVLEQVRIGEGAVLPGGVAAPELRAWLRSLIDRLARLALPPGA